MILRALALAVTLWLPYAAHATPGGEGATRVRTGVACDRSSGALLYRELHEERWVDGRLVEDRVSYRRAEGEVFATKRVDFRASATAPDFDLLDSASGHREALERTADAMVVRYRPSWNARERSATLPSAPTLVADAGFDRFIERNWDRLVAGETMVRPFLIPSRLRTVDMRIRRVRDDARGAGRTVALELAIDSALLRLIVPAVRVLYDTSARTLVLYEGVSNVRDAAGSNADVTIAFSRGPASSSDCRSRQVHDDRG